MKTLYILFTVFLICNATDFSMFSPKCKKLDRNLNKCLVDKFNNAWSQISADYNMQKIKIENVVKSVPNFASGGIVKGALLGYDDIIFNDFDFDFEKKSVHVVYTQPLFSMVGEYYMKGAFLGFPLNDFGHLNITVVDGVYNYQYNFISEKQNGEEYFKIKNYKLTFEPGKLIFDMGSDVDPRRRNLINNLFNNNWRIMNVIIGKAMAEVMSDSYTPYVQEFYKNTPVSALFD